MTSELFKNKIITAIDLSMSRNLSSVDGSNIGSEGATLLSAALCGCTSLEALNISKEPYSIRVYRME